MSDLIFADQKDAARYTLHRGKDLVSVLDYNDDGRTVALTRAYTIPTFRGSGYAAELVKRVVADLERRGDRRIIPVCWYVADWFDANPGHESLLQERSVR
jgi:predicted GNAT family acetyltransferase